MPVKSHQIEGGARVVLFFCEVCDRPAQFGFGVHLITSLRTGNAAKAGKWYCTDHVNGAETSIAHNALIQPEASHAQSQPDLFSAKPDVGA